MTREEIITAQGEIQDALSNLLHEERRTGWEAQDISRQQEIMDERAALRLQFRALADQRVSY